MSDQPEPFADNWKYLRAELVWLDRTLSLAVAKQQQETKVVDRVARTKGDRVTSHWWKGLVTLEGDAAYDSPVEKPRPSTDASLKLNFQQQLTAKIQASQQQGIILGLPTLCDRLQLNRFEKNLLLMALAPEINRRYGRLYNYLQDTDHSGAPGLPTVDLILRILCRNDAEWRAARRSLTAGSTLLHYPILDMPLANPDSLLTRSVKLADPVVNYCLAERPSIEALESLLAGDTGASPVPLSLDGMRSLRIPGRPVSSPGGSMLQSWMPTASPLTSPAIADFPLVLPSQALRQLQHLCDRFQVISSRAADPAVSGLTAFPQGSITLLVGAPGTGKTTAAQALATTLQLPLFFADLALIHPHHFEALLQEIGDRQPHVVLLKSANALLHRTSAVSEVRLHQFFEQRRHAHSLTLIALTSWQSIAAKWRQPPHAVLEFSRPTLAQRQRLWRQALPTDIAPRLDCLALAQVKLTGGEIHAIAQEAMLYAAIAHQSVTLDHVRQALTQFGKRL